MTSRALLLLGDEVAATRAWPPPPRGPLPASPPNVDRELWFDIPSGPDKLFYRGNFCGIRVPGVPLLEGMAGRTVAPWSENQAPFCPPFMAGDVLFYATHGQWDAVQEYFKVYAADGYTHWQANVCLAVEAALTRDEYFRVCRMARDAGIPFLDQWFLGGVWGERDADAAYWRPIVKPWFDALVAEGLIDCACVGWQLDKFNTGLPRQIEGREQAPIQSIVDMFADWCGPREIPLGTHWVNEAGVWRVYWNGREFEFDRFRGWKDQRNKVFFFHHQGDVDIPVDLYQAKLKDTLDPFGNGRMGTSGLFGDRPFGLVIYECSAQAQFDLRCSEDDGDLRGALLLYTKGATHAVGYGNGARRPDGGAL